MISSDNHLKTIGSLRNYLMPLTQYKKGRSSHLYVTSSLTLTLTLMLTLSLVLVFVFVIRFSAGLIKVMSYAFPDHYRIQSQHSGMSPGYPEFPDIFIMSFRGRAPLPARTSATVPRPSNGGRPGVVSTVELRPR